MCSSVRKLRIAFLSGGGFVHIGPYLDYFKSRGHEVCLIAYDRVARDYGVPTFDVSRGASGKKSSSKWRYLLAGGSVRRITRQFGADILHGHYVTSAGTICLLSRFKPYAMTAHGSDLVASSCSKFWRQVVGLALRRSALVNTVSEQLRSIALGMGIPDEKILVSTLGVDTGFFPYRPPEDMQGPVRLLCTRTLGEVYDPFTILKACTILRDRKCAFTLTFAAGGPLMEALRRRAVQEGVSESVRFLGGYSNADLPGLLRTHDVYVSASLWDGTSISLLEAMSCGLAPVVSRIESNKAWVVDGETALMFDCGNAEELARAIEQAMGNAQWRRTAAEMNRETAVRRADRRSNMARLEAAFVKIVEDKTS